MSDVRATERPTRLLRCSFCGKSQTEVKKLISGPGVFICDECVELCLPIIAEKPVEADVANSWLPENTPTDRLLKILAGYNGAFEAVGAAMQDIVDILREREVSWAAIGQILAVSRQAAWKRFGSPS